MAHAALIFGLEVARKASFFKERIEAVDYGLRTLNCSERLSVLRVRKKGKKGISMRQMASRVNRAAKLRTEDVLFLCKEHPQRKQHSGAGICSPL